MPSVSPYVSAPSPGSAASSSPELLDGEVEVLKSVLLLIRVVFQQQFGELQRVRASSGRNRISVQTRMASW